MKRMMLVPPQNLPSPLASKLSRLDAEMKDVLNKADLDDETKLSAYSQVLSRYLSARAQYARPTPIPIVDVPTSSPAAVEIQLDAIPKQYQKKAQLLIDHIRKSPHLGWNQRNEVVINGESLTNTNILDLVDDLVRPKTKRNPRGIQDFVRELKKANVPQTLINNRRRLDDQEQFFSPSTTPSERGNRSGFLSESDVQTPPSRVFSKRSRQRSQSGSGIKWSRW